ncbi:hypothetical protein ACSBR2_036019 [Camellia fascicularis]
MVSCCFASSAWVEMLNWWDVQGALPGTVEGLLLWWDGEVLSSKERKIWRGIPLVVLWSLWKLRNDVVFNAAFPDVAAICEVIKVRVALWMRPYYLDHRFAVQDFVINLRQVRRCIAGRRVLGACLCSVNHVLGGRMSVRVSLVWFWRRVLSVMVSYWFKYAIGF